MVNNMEDLIDADAMMGLSKSSWSSCDSRECGCVRAIIIEAKSDEGKIVLSDESARFCKFSAR